MCFLSWKLHYIRTALSQIWKIFNKKIDLNKQKDKSCALMLKIASGCSYVQGNYCISMES